MTFAYFFARFPRDNSHGTQFLQDILVAIFGEIRLIMFSKTIKINIFVHIKIFVVFSFLLCFYAREF